MFQETCQGDRIGHHLPLLGLNHPLHYHHQPSFAPSLSSPCTSLEWVPTTWQEPVHAHVSLKDHSQLVLTSPPVPLPSTTWPMAHFWLPFWGSAHATGAAQLRIKFIPKKSHIEYHDGNTWGLLKVVSCILDNTDPQFLYLHFHLPAVH